MALQAQPLVAVTVTQPLALEDEYAALAGEQE